ncbi:hypothetical protein SUNI508_01329 [Seiridium unicorne]|uniref:Nucleoporin NUP49/NSP49 n=1 Tax=Seiridium unicorne TaxID=138068 RepID=A0ABR2UXT1_9PEZI
MALARSASGPGGLSINTSSANLLPERGQSDERAAYNYDFEAEREFVAMLARSSGLGTVESLANAHDKPSGNASSAAPPAGGLFGTASQASTTQPSTAPGLFGTTSSAAPSTGGLFGSLNTATSSQPTQAAGPSSGTNAFGSSLGQPQQQAGSNPFGQINNNQNAQPPAGGGLFNTNTANTAQPQHQAGGMFNTNTQASQQAQNSTPFGSSILGGTAQQNPTNAFSTLGSQSTAGFGGSLGQSTNQQTVPGVRIDVSNVRGTTRFNDLQEDLQKKIIWLDDQIQSYMNQKNELSAFMPGHGEMLSNIPNDVKFVQMKYDGVQSALRSDAEAIESVQTLHGQDGEHGILSFRALDNLKLPQQYHTTGLWSSRSQAGATANAESDGQDIVNFFSKTADEMDEQLKRYENNLTEIELHMHGIQGSLIEQLQRMMATKNGGPSPSDEQLAELGAVLRDFEQSILEVAQHVGGAREGMTRLQLGDFIPSQHQRSGVY